MQFIIKPTSKCNFNCTFCSAKRLDIDHSSKLHPLIKDQILLQEPENLIITGGEPFMLDIEFYWDLLKFLSINSLDTTLSITSNLKSIDDWIKWKPLLTHPKVQVTTSFQLDNKRGGNEAYSESDFKKVVNTFYAITGYMPIFISVIDYDNESTCLDLVRLAKSLKTKVKLNNVLPMGGSSEYYPRYKMFDIYKAIIDRNLGEYEVNCQERLLGRCNFNTSGLCESSIRACWVSNNKLIWGNCEDQLTNGKSIPLDLIKVEPKENNPTPIKSECLFCSLYKLCNGCKFQKQFIDQTFCDEMKKRKDFIEQYWKI